MNASSFTDFFRRATATESNPAGNTPYDYQCRLACGERAANEPESEWLAGGTDCNSRLIDVPTGLGKTAAVVFAWLWNRVIRNDPSWPRRLVYCLPMRTLVEQIRDSVVEWITKILETAAVGQLALSAQAREQLQWLKSNSPVILMGGEDAIAWDIYPGKPAILIGTQDMLLSRALNRGYGMSRYRWPMHFGLLNNDCLWVMDETQLMGPGIATAAQLEAFRAETSFGCLPRGRSATWYASATASAAQLVTREWRDKPRPDGFKFALSKEEKAATAGPLAQHRLARKTIECHQDWNFGDKQLGSRADEIIQRHRSMIAALAGIATDAMPRRSLIICNTVRRAIADVIAVLTGSPNPQVYWRVLKKRLRDEGNQTVTNCNALKLTAADGKQRLTDVANAEQLLRLIQSIPSPKAEPFKLWLARVGYERLEEIENPELAAQRMREIYRQKGYSEDWIEKRMRGIANALTSKSGLRHAKTYSPTVGVPMRVLGCVRSPLPCPTMPIEVPANSFQLAFRRRD